MKEHVEVIKDSFTDYAGRTHHFIIAAVTSNLENTEIDNIEFYNDKIVITYPKDLTGVLRIGVSICNPEDEFVEKIGVLKAVGRARNSNPVLYVTKLGYINKNLVKAFLEREAEYLKSNPDKYIKGYNECKERYFKRKGMEELKDNFSSVEKIIVESVQKDPKFLDNINIYLTWLNNQNKGKCKKHGK